MPYSILIIAFKIGIVNIYVMKLQNKCKNEY